VASKIAWLAVDSTDPAKLARWWMEVLGNYEVEYDSAEAPTPVLEDGMKLDVEPDEPEVLIKSPSGHRILFLKVPDQKSVKNRLHLDLRPDDRDAEVARLEAMGAKQIDIGQGSDKSWVVMADIEGNEFCILRALTEEEARRGDA
jgi:hypothetical protein